MDTCLVVANRTLGGRRLMEVIQDRVEGGTRDFLVVVPLVPTEHEASDGSLPVEAGPAPLAPDPDLPLAPPRDGTGRRTPGTAVAPEQTVEQAQRRLEGLLGRIRATGASAEGRLGDPHPVVAVEEALRAPRVIVEIILSTLSASISPWVGMDLPSRIRRATNLPVTVVETGQDPIPPARATPRA